MMYICSTSDYPDEEYLDMASDESQGLPAAPDTSWDPDQYNQFMLERQQPFYDLLSKVCVEENMVSVDLGCGTGQMTQHLHHYTGAVSTLGLDSSASMMQQSAAFVDDGLQFALDDIQNLSQYGHFDLIFSNAALHWVPDHKALFHTLIDSLSDQGQLAIQMPCNGSHPSQRVIAEVAQEEPFATALQGFYQYSHVQEPEFYASLFHNADMEHTVEMKVYGHTLANVDAVVEWLKGSALTAFQDRLSEAEFEQFVARYSERLHEELGEQSPYYLTYRRLFLHAKK